MLTTEFSVVIDDDPVAGTQIRNALRNNGYRCEWFDSAKSAVDRMMMEKVSLVVLNLGSGEDAPVNIVRAVRNLGERISIILLTKLDAGEERSECIGAGADDFIVLPLQIPELIARVEAARIRSKPRAMLTLGTLRMDLTRRRVERKGRPITLTPTEFRILEILLMHQGTVVTRRMLCELLWNPDWEGVTNVIEVHINRLRSKIAADGEDRMIQTVRGSGYVLKLDPQRYPAEANGGQHESVAPANN